MKMLAPLENPLFESSIEVHSHDPWWLARYRQQMEKTAFHNLSREGFECWTPTYKSVRQLPLRKVPPKRRNQAKLYLEQVRLKRFPGYVLIRRTFGHFDVNRLFDLAGCGGVVTMGGKPVLVQDFDVELMRLTESDGTHDVYQLRSMPLAYYKVNYLSGEEDLKRQHDSIGPMKRRLDDSDGLSLKVDAFGRVSHLIAGADQI